MIGAHASGTIDTLRESFPLLSRRGPDTEGGEWVRMSEILIRNADTVLTMDANRRELHGADVLLRGGVVAAVGPGLTTAGRVVEARGCVVTPGLVNTHHHLFQTLTRAVPGGQDALLFGWLKTLYPIWARFGPAEMFISAQVGLAELALSGCTMTSDHLYLMPNGSRLDDTISAAREVFFREIGRLFLWCTMCRHTWGVCALALPLTTQQCAADQA